MTDCGQEMKLVISEEMKAKASEVIRSEQGSDVIPFFIAKDAEVRGTVRTYMYVRMFVAMYIRTYVQSYVRTFVCLYTYEYV